MSVLHTWQHRPCGNTSADATIFMIAMYKYILHKVCAAHLATQTKWQHFCRCHTIYDYYVHIYKRVQLLSRMCVEMIKYDLDNIFSVENPLCIYILLKGNIDANLYITGG